MCLKCIILVINFQKSPNSGGFLAPGPLTFDIGDLKWRDLAKLCFFKVIMTKSNLKNQLWGYFNDVIIITSPKYIFPFCSNPIKISGYATGQLGLQEFFTDVIFDVFFFFMRK